MPTRDEIFEYLEWLRESGMTNMFGAAPYLQYEFSISEAVARRWLVNWMTNRAAWLAETGGSFDREQSDAD